MARCKHRRQTKILETVQCRREAARDGYCARHHPDYVSPATRQAEAKISLSTLSDEAGFMTASPTSTPNGE